MHGVVTDRSNGTGATPDGGTGTGLRGQEAKSPEPSVDWRDLGLEAMSSLLVVWMRRTGTRCFTAQCQWPRFHPLNERAVNDVPHHPLIMVESTRQLALALRREYESTARQRAFEAVSLNAGISFRSWPKARGSATDVCAQVTLSDLVTRAGMLTSFRITTEYRHTGSTIGSCTIKFVQQADEAVIIPAPQSRQTLLHPPAAAVGAAADPNVLLARAPQGRLLITPRDPEHPVLLTGRPSRLPAQTVLEAGRQAVLLNCGATAAAVVGLRVDLQSPVPSRGALVEVAAEPRGYRFLVTAAGRLAAAGAITLLKP